MGHDFHFLQRIERLSPAQADLALALYRGPELVAHLLRSVKLPEAAERVALALEHTPAGPHVIVARNGHFVTCLAEGMTLGGCPVVSRAQLDRASERIELLRAALAERGETRRLCLRLLQGGSTVSREDFLRLATLVPILGREYIATAVALTKYLVEVQDGYRRSRYRKITPLVHEELKSYWASQWAIGHLAAVCAERSDEIRDLFSRDQEDYEGFMRGLVELAMHCMSTPILMRGAWTAARAGRMLLPWLRQRLQDSLTRADVLMAGVPLATMGLRHRRSYAEVSKVLGVQSRKLEASRLRTLEHLRDPEHLHMEMLVVHLEKLMDPEVRQLLLDDHRLCGAQAYAAFTARFPAGAPMRITNPDDVPEDLALSILMNFDGDLYGSMSDIFRTLTVVPWLATASGADMYLPASFFEQCGPVFVAEATRTRLDSYYRYYMLDRPARAAERPGRNQPCACGSGKKYKRCCGAA